MGAISSIIPLNYYKIDGAMEAYNNFIIDVSVILGADELSAGKQATEMIKLEKQIISV